MNKSKLTKWFREWWLLLVPATFALGAIAAYTVVFRSMPATENPAAWGTFGDFIGGLTNPLVSVLTLFVAISVWRLQKAELELTRGEMAQTKEAMADQAKTAEQQRREQRFFDLFHVYQSTVESVTHTRIRSTSLSSELLNTAGKRAISEWLAQNGFDNVALKKFDQTLLESKLWKHWESCDGPGQFDHYLRVVKQLLQELEHLLGDQHERYAVLFLTQLSRSELLILGFCVWLDERQKGMMPFFEKYGLLRHLPDGHLRHEIQERHPRMLLPTPHAA